MRKQDFSVVLVDDDEDDRFLFGEAFEELNVNIGLSIFKNGKEFIDHLEDGLTEIPNLVFLDLNMPIMNGIDCLKYLKKRALLSKIFVAIYSTSNAAKDFEETFHNGANIYIQKPDNFQCLVKVIDKAIKTCLQYGDSRLNKDNFILKL